MIDFSCTGDIISLLVAGASISLTTWIGFTMFRGNNGKNIRGNTIESSGSTQFKRTRDRNVALEIASNARARRWSARIKVVIDGEIAN